MPHVGWAEESKTGLGFEIGPSYDGVPATSQYATAWQSPAVASLYHFTDNVRGWYIVEY